MTFSPLLFADDGISSLPIWISVIAIAVLAASAAVWIAWQRSNSLGRDFFGPRDPRSENVRPWGQVVLLGFMSMILVGIATAVLFSKELRELPAEPEARERITLQIEVLRWSVAGNAAILAMVLAFSYWQVRLTAGEQLPWIGLIPNARDLRHGLLLGIACVPLLYIVQGFLQYLLVQVFQQPQIEHPLIDMLRKNKGADQELVAELFLWVAVSVTVLAPILEELLFRGLLQGWLRAKYQAMAQRILGVDHGAIAPPTRDTENPYQASQLHLHSTPAEVQRRRLTTWAPIFIASMAFSLAHATHGPAPIPLFFFSLALGYVYEKTGRLAPSIIAHLLLNLTTTIMLWLMISGRIPAE